MEEKQVRTRSGETRTYNDPLLKDANKRFMDKLKKKFFQNEGRGAERERENFKQVPPKVQSPM